MPFLSMDYNALMIVVFIPMAHTTQIYFQCPGCIVNNETLLFLNRQAIALAFQHFLFVNSSKVPATFFNFWN